MDIIEEKIRKVRYLESSIFIYRGQGVIGKRALLIGRVNRWEILRRPLVAFYRVKDFLKGIFYRG